MTSYLNRSEGNDFYFIFRTEMRLQICKQIGALHFSIPSWPVWCPSCMGQPENTMAIAFSPSNMVAFVKASVTV